MSGSRGGVLNLFRSFSTTSLIIELSHLPIILSIKIIANIHHCYEKWTNGDGSLRPAMAKRPYFSLNDFFIPILRPFNLYHFPYLPSELFSNMIYDSLCSFILEAKYNLYYFGRISASFHYLYSSNNRDIAKVFTFLRFIISALIKNFADATTRE